MSEVTSTTTKSACLFPETIICAPRGHRLGPRAPGGGCDVSGGAPFNILKLYCLFICLFVCSFVANEDLIYLPLGAIQIMISHLFFDNFHPPPHLLNFV